MKNIRKLSQHYKVQFYTTLMVEKDYKMIKRINNLFARLEKTGKDTYVQEIVNILRTLDNILFIERIHSIFYSVLDDKYHGTIDSLITSMIGDSVE